MSPSHSYGSAKTWQCSDNAWDDSIRECAWVQYSGSYLVLATKQSNGTTYWNVYDVWSSAYIWNAVQYGYNSWAGFLGAMHTTATFYYPNGKSFASIALSPGLCGAAPAAYPTSTDLFPRLCDNKSLGPWLAVTLPTKTYPSGQGPFYVCYRTYFDSTFMYDNDFGWSGCQWVNT